jgi:hypothetical protein
MVIFLVVVGAIIFEGIFNFDNFNLEVSGFGIQGHLYANQTFSRELSECKQRECRVISQREHLEQFADMVYHAYFEDKGKRNCTGLKLELWISERSNNTEVLIVKVSFLEDNNNLFRCRMPLKQLLEMKEVQAIMNEEVAFYTVGLEPSLRAFLSLEISGVVPGAFAHFMKFDKSVSDVGLNTQLSQSPRLVGGQTFFDDNSFVDYREHKSFSSLFGHFTPTSVS